VCVAWESSVGIATRYGKDGPGIESRWGTRFPAPVQTDPEAHPASYTMGTGSFPGLKRPGRGVDHPPTSSAEVKERVELYLYSPLWAFVTCYRVNFTFIIIIIIFGLNVFGCSVGTCMNRWVTSCNRVS